MKREKTRCSLKVCQSRKRSAAPVFAAGIDHGRLYQGHERIEASFASILQKKSCENVENEASCECSSTRTRGLPVLAEAWSRTADWVSPQAMLFVCDLGHKELKHEHD